VFELGTVQHGLQPPRQRGGNAGRARRFDTSTYVPFGLEAFEVASRDEIAALQRDRLKTHATTCLRERAGHLTDSRQLDDLQKYPFTTKQDLRDN
jgi:phenylacetate-coenzyme A ligase PaaK-like adenylate-forming protein